MPLQTPQFWYDTAAGRALAYVLAPLGAVYGFISRQRFGFYHPIPLARPVICVGNLVAGGAGKTPVVASLVKLLQDRGFNPHILSRGYGGAEEGPLQVSPGRDTAEDVGDEPLILVNHAPTWVAKSRALGAQAAIDTGANVIVMDDGFQNPALYKDLSLVVIDGAVGFGNGFTMPAGPLREDIGFGLSRADAAVIVGSDDAGVVATVKSHRADLPVFFVDLVPAENNPAVAGQVVYAFAGIGRPEKFRRSLEQAGASLEGWGAFPDHHPYTEDDLRELMAAAEGRGALILTTAKDHVRLPEALKPRIGVFAVEAVWQAPAAITALAETVLARASVYPSI